VMRRRGRGIRVFRGLWIALTIAGTALPCVPTPSRFGPSTPNFSQYLKYELLTLTGGAVRSPRHGLGSGLWRKAILAPDTSEALALADDLRVENEESTSAADAEQDEVPADAGDTASSWYLSHTLVRRVYTGHDTRRGSWVSGTLTVAASHSQRSRRARTASALSHASCMPGGLPTLLCRLTC